DHLGEGRPGGDQHPEPGEQEGEGPRPPAGDETLQRPGDPGPKGAPEPAELLDPESRSVVGEQDLAEGGEADEGQEPADRDATCLLGPGTDDLPGDPVQQERQARGGPAE